MPLFFSLPCRKLQKGTFVLPSGIINFQSQAAAKVAANLVRMASGNFSKSKSISGGVYESRIDFGPGYRVYFGKDGKKIIILLGGGTKKKQRVDIQKAHELWKEYKKRKKRG